jgi:hypothetical protein
MNKLTLTQGDNNFGAITVQVDGTRARVYRWNARHSQYQSVLRRDCPDQGGIWYSSDISYVCGWHSLGGRLRAEIWDLVQPIVEQAARDEQRGNELVEVEE